MAFIKFTESGRSFAPKVSLSPKGMISFNDGARKRFKIDQYKFCILYFDREASLIGIELTNDSMAEGINKIRFRTTGADLGGKTFLDFFQITPKITTMYEATEGPREGWISIDVSKGRPRKGATSVFE